MAHRRDGHQRGKPPTRALLRNTILAGFGCVSAAASTRSPPVSLASSAAALFVTISGNNKVRHIPQRRRVTSAPAPARQGGRLCLFYLPRQGGRCDGRGALPTEAAALHNILHGRVDGTRSSTSGNARTADVQEETTPGLLFPNKPLELVTFDATDTLMQLRSEVGTFYRQALVEASANDDVKRERLPPPSAFSDAFKRAYVEQDGENPNFGHAVMTSREWWRGVVRRTYEYVELGDGQHYYTGQVLEKFDEEVFERLYSDVFLTEEAWELKPGALEVVRYFRKWKEKTGEGGTRSSGVCPALGILSNWDERLHPLLDNLGIYDAFDFVLTSREVGSAKPDPRAYEAAISMVGAIGGGVADPGACLHVGNGFQADVTGAAEAGWHAVYVPRDGVVCNVRTDAATDGEKRVVYSVARDLFEVLRMFGSNGGPAWVKNDIERK